MHLSSGCFDHFVSRSRAKKALVAIILTTVRKRHFGVFFSYVQHSLHQREDFSGSCLYAQDQAYTKKSANRMG